MWSKFVALIMYLALVKSEITAPGIDREIFGLGAAGINSKGYKVVYGDEDLTVINEAVGKMEESEVLKPKVRLNDAIKPLQAEDVKCLMSVDKYCSKDMRQVKGVLIQALKNDCEKCSNNEKESAGKVAAAMMSHDPVAWKLFLTRSALQNRPPKKPTQPPKINLKHVGEPEEVESKYRFAMPGVKVRVKRYYAEKIP